MLGISGKPFEAIDDEFAEAADIFISGRKHADGRRLDVEIRLLRIPCCGLRQSRCIGKLRQQRTFHIKRMDDGTDDRLAVEIHVGNGDEEIDCDQVVDFRGNRLPFRAKSGCDGRETFCDIYEQILHRGNFRLLSAYSADGAAFATGCFLTLKAEHLVFHSFVSYVQFC